MQCCINAVVTDEVPKFLKPLYSVTIHAIQVNYPINDIHIIIPLQSTYFDLRKPTPKNRSIQVSS